jgi:GNAT superfamily N-acetyltransferase
MTTTSTTVDTIRGASTIVRAATADDTEAISVALAGAFTDDPVFSWCIPDRSRRERVLPSCFTMFAQAYQQLGASQVIGPVAGAALWAPPGVQAIGEEDAEEFAHRIGRIVGDDSARIFDVLGLLEEQHPQGACYYLNFIGVASAHQGNGLGSVLLAAALRRCDQQGQPAYLEATSPDNRRLYARHGFEVVTEIVLPDGPPLWPMWRDPRG